MTTLDQEKKSEKITKKEKNEEIKQELSDILDISQFLNEKGEIDPEKFSKEIEYFHMQNIFGEMMLKMQYRGRWYVIDKNKKHVKGFEHGCTTGLIDPYFVNGKEYLRYEDQGKVFMIDKEGKSPIGLEEGKPGIWTIAFGKKEIFEFNDDESNYLCLKDTRFHDIFNEDFVEVHKETSVLHFRYANKKYLVYKGKDKKRHLMGEDGKQFPGMEEGIGSIANIMTINDKCNESYEMLYYTEKNDQNDVQKIYLRSLDGTLMQGFEHGYEMKDTDLSKLELFRFGKNIGLLFVKATTRFLVCFAGPFAGKPFPGLEKWFYRHEFHTIQGNIYMSYRICGDDTKTYLVSEYGKPFPGLENGADGLYTKDTSDGTCINYEIGDEKYIIFPDGEVMSKDEAEVKKKRDTTKKVLNTVFGNHQAK